MEKIENDNKSKSKNSNTNSNKIFDLRQKYLNKLKNLDYNQVNESSNKIESDNQNIEMIYQSENIKEANTKKNANEQFIQNQNTNFKVHQATNLNIKKLEVEPEVKQKLESESESPQNVVYEVVSDSGSQEEIHNYDSPNHEVEEKNNNEIQNLEELKENKENVLIPSIKEYSQETNEQKSTLNQYDNHEKEEEGEEEKEIKKDETNENENEIDVEEEKRREIFEADQRLLFWKEFFDTSNVLERKKALVLNPIPENAGFLLMTIKRFKASFAKRMNPKYELIVSGDLNFVLSAKKKSWNKSSYYMITFDQKNASVESPNYIGKLRSNFMGSEFVLYEKGLSFKDTQDLTKLRIEHEVICYDSNVLGTNGPRRMSIYIPKLTEEMNFRFIIKPKSENETMLSQVKEGNIKDLLKYINKPPKWDPSKENYILYFNGRVTEGSVKNFQIIESSDSFVKQEMIF